MKIPLSANCFTVPWYHAPPRLARGGIISQSMVAGRAGIYGRMRSALADPGRSAAASFALQGISGTVQTERSARMYAWTNYDSPLGTLTLAGSEEALTGLWAAGAEILCRHPGRRMPSGGMPCRYSVRQYHGWMLILRVVPFLPCRLWPRWAATSARRSGAAAGDSLR